MTQIEILRDSKFTQYLRNESSDFVEDDQNKALGRFLALKLDSECEFLSICDKTFSFPTFNIFLNFWMKIFITAISAKYFDIDIANWEFELHEKALKRNQ